MRIKSPLCSCVSISCPVRVCRCVHKKPHRGIERTVRLSFIRYLTDWGFRPLQRPPLPPLASFTGFRSLTLMCCFFLAGIFVFLCWVVCCFCCVSGTEQQFVARP